MRSLARIFTIALLVFVAFSAEAQDGLQFPTLSPVTEISQEAGLTEIGLSYSRPSAKGRKVFGELVPFDKLWRTGANASTKLTFNESVSIAGNELSAGTYALYSIPGEKTWTMIIHTNTGHRSIAGDTYNPEEDAFRFEVESKSISNYIETFTIQFTDIKTDQISITLSWENTMVSFPIDLEVDTKIEAQIAETGDDLNPFALFRVSEYYYHNDKSLAKAEDWIRQALVKSPENFRFGLLHAKIVQKKGENKRALEIIEQSNQWAVNAKNDNYIEQTQIYWDSIK